AGVTEKVHVLGVRVGVVGMTADRHYFRASGGRLFVFASTVAVSSGLFGSRYFFFSRSGALSAGARPCLPPAPSFHSTSTTYSPGGAPSPPGPRRVKVPSSPTVPCGVGSLSGSADPLRTNVTVAPTAGSPLTSTFPPTGYSPDELPHELHASAQAATAKGKILVGIRRSSGLVTRDDRGRRRYCDVPAPEPRSGLAADGVGLEERMAEGFDRP